MTCHNEDYFNVGQQKNIFLLSVIFGHPALGLHKLFWCSSKTR